MMSLSFQTTVLGVGVEISLLSAKSKHCPYDWVTGMDSPFEVQSIYHEFGAVPLCVAVRVTVISVCIYCLIVPRTMQFWVNTTDASRLARSTDNFSVTYKGSYTM